MLGSLFCGHGVLRNIQNNCVECMQLSYNKTKSVPNRNFTLFGQILIVISTIWLNMYKRSSLAVLLFFFLC